VFIRMLSALIHRGNHLGAVRPQWQAPNHGEGLPAEQPWVMVASRGAKAIHALPLERVIHFGLTIH
jgi:hypothetical protein